jgi:hypothetical protein
MEATCQSSNLVGCADFPFADDTNASMKCEPDKIMITRTRPGRARDIETQRVSKCHLDRFALRAVPLKYTWTIQ